MKTTKAEVEIQFNWIFVVIIGGVILAFFIILSGAIKRGSDEGLDYDILNIVDEIFTSSETNVNTEKTVSLAGKSIRVDCNFYSIASSQYEGQGIQSRPVFSPSLVEGTALTYSLFWETPFKVSSFLYITSPKVQYVILDDGNYAEKLNMALPRQAERQIVADLSSFQNQNYKRIRIIFFGVQPAVPNLKIPDSSVSAVRITPVMDTDSFPEGYGKLEFFRKQGSALVSEGESAYAGEALLTGGVYSESRELYECNAGKAMTRLGMISDMLMQRISGIEEANLPGCSYATARQKLSAVKSSSSLAALESLYTVQSELYAENYNLQKQSCPHVY